MTIMHDCGPLIMKQLGDKCRWDFGANLLEIACARVLVWPLVCLHACLYMHA